MLQYLTKKLLPYVATACLCAAPLPAYAHNGDGDGLTKSSVGSRVDMTPEHTHTAILGTATVPFNENQGRVTLGGFLTILSSAEEIHKEQNTVGAGYNTIETYEGSATVLFGVQPTLSYAFALAQNTKLMLEYGLQASLIPGIKHTQETVFHAPTTTREKKSDGVSAMLVSGIYRTLLTHQVGKTSLTAQVSARQMYYSEVIQEPEEIDIASFELAPSLTARINLGDVVLRLSMLQSFWGSELHSAQGVIGTTLPIGGGLETAVSFGLTQVHQSEVVNGIEVENEEAGFGPIIGFAVTYFFGERDEH